MTMEDVIINAVSKYPGSNMHGFSDEVKRVTNGLVAQERLCIRYNGTEKRYYTPEQIKEMDAERDKVYLDARRCDDGAIHIYLKDEDVGMKIRPSISEDHMVIDTDDESFGFMKLSDVARLRDKIGEQLDRIGELAKELEAHVDKLWTCENANKHLVAKEEMWLRKLHSSKVCSEERLTTILQQSDRIDELVDEIKQIESITDLNSTTSRDTINKQSARIDELIDERIRLANQVRELEKVTKSAECTVQSLHVNAFKLACKMVTYENEFVKLVDEKIYLANRVRSFEHVSKLDDGLVRKLYVDAIEQREENANIDATAWKKRESDLLQMIAHRDTRIFMMDSAFVKVGE